MGVVRSITDAIVPNVARRYLYSQRSEYLSRQRERHRKRVFDNSMAMFLSDPVGAVDAQDDLIPNLIYGWGNEQWSALDKYLRECLKHTLSAEGPILECGSGLTSILLGVIAQMSGKTVWSLENNTQWAVKVEDILKRYRIVSVRLIVAPLKSFGEFAWYDTPLGELPSDFSLVICDGPPASTPGGRFGLLPIMKERLKPGSTILLDDADRSEERTIGMRWAEELNGSYELCGTDNPYVIISLPNQ